MRTPDSWQTARATVAIALSTALVFLVVTVMQPRWIGYLAFFSPDWRLGENMPLALVTPLTATLLHSGLAHLALNMLVLLFCGRAVEGALGTGGFLILYGLGAYAAAIGQFAIDPLSPLPMIGASGAISAVIGAYAMLFGRNRVRVANARLAMWLNVLWLLAAWIALQAAMVIVISTSTSGVLLAVGAHVGGFALGVLLARPLLLWRYRKA